MSLFRELEFFCFERETKTTSKYIGLLLFYRYVLLKTFNKNILLNNKFFFMGGLQAYNLNLFRHKNEEYKKIFYNYYKIHMKKKIVHLHYKSTTSISSRITHIRWSKSKRKYYCKFRINVVSKYPQYIRANYIFKYNKKFETNFVFRYRKRFKVNRIPKYPKKFKIKPISKHYGEFGISFIYKYYKEFSIKWRFLNRYFSNIHFYTQIIKPKKIKLRSVFKIRFLSYTKKIDISKVFLFKENRAIFSNSFLEKSEERVEKVKVVDFIKLEKKSIFIKKRLFAPLLKKNKNKNALHTQNYVIKRKHVYIKKFIFFCKYSYLKKHLLNSPLTTVPCEYHSIVKYGAYCKKAADRLKKIILLKYIKNKKKKIYKTGLFFFLKKVDKKNYFKIKNLKPLYMKKKSIYINYLNIIQKKEKKEKIIYNNLFLNKFSVKSFFIDFYLNSKQTKNILKKNTKQKKTFFFNFWKKKLTTFKCARAIHWGYYTKKTIKKRRYKNFLSFFLKKLNRNGDYIINYFILKFSLSYIFWKNFTTLYLEFFEKKIKEKAVYQIPVSLLFWTFLKKNQSIKKKIQKKIQKWIRNKKKIQKKFWMKSKQNIPPFFAKQIYHNKHASNGVQYDFLTNYFCILKKKKMFTPLNGPIGSNKLLKLHDFRYKA